MTAAASTLRRRLPLGASAAASGARSSASRSTHSSSRLRFIAAGASASACLSSARRRPASRSDALEGGNAGQYSCSTSAPAGAATVLSTGTGHASLVAAPLPSRPSRCDVLSTPRLARCAARPLARRDAPRPTHVNGLVITALACSTSRRLGWQRIRLQSGRSGPGCAAGASPGACRPPPSNAYNATRNPSSASRLPLPRPGEVAGPAGPSPLRPSAPTARSAAPARDGESAAT